MLEKLVSLRLSLYLEEHGLLHSSQSSFHPRHSTETALVEVADFIRTTRDGGRNEALFLFDLSVAFDTIPHDRLLIHLAHSRISGLAIQ